MPPARLPPPPPAGGPAADDRPEMPPADRHVAEDALDPLPAAGSARARRPVGLAPHRLPPGGGGLPTGPGPPPAPPRGGDRLARGHVQPQVLLARERDVVHDAAPAGRVPLVGDVEQHRL